MSALALLAGSPLARADIAAETEALWRDLRGLRFAEAAARADRLPATDAPAARLARALGWLHGQPKTQVRLRDAANELEALGELADQPEIAAAAWYYRGRLAQHHEPRAAPTAGEPHYRAARERYPATLFGQLAAVQSMLAALYADDAPWPERAARAEALLEPLLHPIARRDGHLALGHAAVFFREEPHRALRHLRAADATSAIAGSQLADLDLAIADLARELGEPAVARHHWERFLAVNLRDPRRELVQARLAALGDSEP